MTKFVENYLKFPEAYQFIDAKIGFSVSNQSDFDKVFDKLNDTDLSMEVIQFMDSQVGATQKIFQKVFR